MGEKSNRRPFVAKAEKINHPKHYINENGVECIDAMIKEFGIEKTAIWCEITEFKYQFRKGKKDGEPEEDDLAKAKWYSDKAAELRCQMLQS